MQTYRMSQMVSITFPHSSWSPVLVNGPDPSLQKPESIWIPFPDLPPPPGSTPLQSVSIRFPKSDSSSPLPWPWPGRTPHRTPGPHHLSKCRSRWTSHCALTDAFQPPEEFPKTQIESRPYSLQTHAEVKPHSLALNVGIRVRPRPWSVNQKPRL